MAININAKTTGVGGLETSADNSGNINIQSGGSTVMSVTSSGVAVTGSFSQNGAVYSTQPSFRNLIINGDMRIAQRNAGSADTIDVDGKYTLDRWKASSKSAPSFNRYTVQQVTDAPNNATYSLKVTSLVSYTLASDDYHMISQYIEGTNIAHLGFGTANAKTVTVSFYVKSSLTGNFGGSLRNSAGNRSYPFSYTIDSANTWEKKTVTIEGDTTGTWVTSTATGMILWLGLGVGSQYSGTAGAWSANNYFSTTGATSVVGTSGATWQITGVQLEVGSTATEFEHLPYDVELARCQRYFQKSWAQGTAVGTAISIDDLNAVQQSWGSSNSGGIAGQAFLLPVVMRATPTLLTYDTNLNQGKVTILYAGANGDVNISYNQISSNDSKFRVRMYANSAYGIVFAYTLTAEL